MTDELVIDGAFGEGGGQIVRTAVCLAALTGRALLLENIRAGRKNPGLAAQHLTAVRAAGALCGAKLSGDALGSQRLRFEPGSPSRPGLHLFDVAEAREGGSAGAVTLVLQTILLPLALAAGDSDVALRGGTHVAWSPPFDYARDVWLATLARLGVTASLELSAYGWYPAGRGEVRLTVTGLGAQAGGPGARQAAAARLEPLDARERGALGQVFGRAVAANLPSHVAQRMADRARALLAEQGIETRIEPRRVRATSPGAGIFLTAEYENSRAGFNALGERGKPSEAVAEEAVAALIAHRDSGAALDLHLADQLVLPLALAEGRSCYTVERITRHLTTSAWVVERFALAEVEIEGAEGEPGTVTVTPAAPGGGGP
ncbi:MAG: RNA 3'-terminal phosphate cyclase [Alphaproteobacteria bacterium]